MAKRYAWICRRPTTNDCPRNGGLTTQSPAQWFPTRHPKPGAMIYRAPTCHGCGLPMTADRSQAVITVASSCGWRF